MRLRMARDRISGIVLFLVALLVVWESRGLPLGTLQHPGPGFVPILLAAGLGIAGLVVLVQGGKSPSIRSIRWPEWKHASVVLSACVFMPLALETLGYRLTVALLLAFLLGVIERRGIALTAAIALGAAWGTYWLFNDILLVLLPQGVLGF